MYSLFALLFLSSVYARLEVEGPCNLTSITYQKQFSNSLTGTWYQVQRIPNDIETGECSQSLLRVSMEIIMDDNTTTVQSSYKYDSEVVNQKLVLRNGTITANQTEPGLLKISYDDVSQDYVVLGADSKDYLVLYSCKNSGSRSIISAWKFGRNTTYSEATTNLTRTLSDNANINDTHWKTVLHTEAACKVKNGAAMLQISPFIIMIIAVLAISKEI
ncbi:apolipoprotein D-like [Bicyclus anynana]|uniref:Apolipoprotein D-like n=1 Tax=Bicyclus anynana TaxID=110368 RepID=A0A6J1NWQ5_BICAN|nr:apolipoprotein D-like [Bicyclus anynana]